VGSISSSLWQHLCLGVAQKEREEVYLRAVRWFEDQGLADEGARYAITAQGMDLAGRLMANSITSFLSWG